MNAEQWVKAAPGIKTGSSPLARFWNDMVGVLVSPKFQLAAIRERNIVWESLLLLFIGFLIAFEWMGGIYFRRDPFPAYSLLVSVLFAVGLVLFHVATVHWAARLLGGGGSYRSLLSIYGFANVPKGLVFGLLLALVLIAPAGLVKFVSAHHLTALLIMLPLIIPAVVGSFVLKILSLRVAYGIRDAKCVGVLILSSMLFGIVVVLPLVLLVAGSMRVSLREITPYLQSRYDVAEAPNLSFNVPLDLVSFRLREPVRFELVSVPPRDRLQNGSRSSRAKALRQSLSFRAPEQKLVRVVGAAGDRVAVRNGRVWLNGSELSEDYRAVENSELNIPEVSVPARHIFVLADDRRFDASKIPSGAIPLSSVVGRPIIKKYPFGWLFWKPEIFRNE
ncbi:MAG TPA: S26 family signal peptidase [Acidobacteriota bacterium]